MSRWRRAAQRAVATGAASILFATTFAGALALHADLPVTRRLVARVASSVLASLFLGKIVVEEIDRIDSDGLTVRRASVLDPTGRKVIRAEGVHVRFHLGYLAKQIASPPSDGMKLVFDHVTIDDAEVDLDGDPATGNLRLVETFKPRPKPPGPKGPPTVARPVRVAIPDILVHHGWAHGAPSPGVPIDASADEIHAMIDIDTARAVELDVAPVVLRSKLLTPLDPEGTGDFHLRVPLVVGGGQAVMTSRFEGSAAKVPIVASARIEGALLHAEVDAARLSPEEVARLFPGATIAEAFSLHATADGPFNALQIAARAVSGPGEVTLDAELRVGKEITADADLHVRDFDPRVLVKTAPNASVGGDAHAHVAMSALGVAVDLDVASFPLTIEGHSIPGATFKGRYEGKVLSGTAQVFEPGALATVKLRVDPGGGVDFEAAVAAKSLAAMPRLRGALDGAVRGTVAGRLDRAGIDARVDATLGNVGSGTTRIGGGVVHGRVNGPFARLRVDATIDAQRLSLGGAPVERGRVRVAGPIASPHVTLSLADARWTELRLEGDLTTRGGVRAENLSGAFAKEGLRTELKAHGIALEKGGATLQGLEVRGESGDVVGSVAVTDRGVVADLEGTVDLAKIARQVPHFPLSQGSAKFALHTKADDRHRTGHLAVHVEGAELSLLPFLVFADASVDLDGDRVAADATARVQGSDAELVSAHATALGKLTGSLLSTAAWSNVTGDVSVERATAHLDQIRNDGFVKTVLLALPDAPDVGGELELRGTVGRDTSAGVDRFTVRLDTDGLTVVPTKGIDTAKRAWTGYDAHVALNGVRAAGKGSERMALALSAQVSDPSKAPLATVTAQSTAPIGELFGDLVAVGAQSEGAAAARDRLAALPLVARASWVARPIATWPAPIRPPHLVGLVSASVALDGTLRDPIASATVTAMGLATEIPGAEPWPADIVLTAKLTGEEAALVGRLAHGGDPLAEGRISAKASLPAMLWANADRHAWTADAEVRFAKMPLESVPFFASRGAVGALTGTFRAAGIHAQPVIDVDLLLEGAKLFDAPLKRGHVVGHVTGGGDAITVTLEQDPSSYAPDGGLLRVTVLPSIAFKHGLVPRLDETRGQTAAIQLRRFDIEPFAPFVSRFLADLRGYVDGEATLAVTAPTADGARSTKLWGKLGLREGVVLVPQLGQTFSHGTFDVQTSEAPGGTHVVLEGMSFTATSGRVTGAAAVDLPTDRVAAMLFGEAPGEAPAKMTGRATLVIAPSEKIPVTFEGVPLGDAFGRIEASVHADARNVDFVVAIPDLSFELPETDTRGVQGLAENVDVGVMDKAHRLAKKVRADTAVRVSLLAGIGDTLDEAETNAPTSSGTVIVRRGGLDVRLRGRPKVELSDALRVDGTVETLSGRVLALGKPFNVERGFVRFEGETPENPYLALRASWDTPEGTRVYAELVGYLRDAKLSLRSEPPRSESEVLSLILFGRDQQAAQTLPGQTSDAGVAAGSGVASSVLNSLLDPVQVFGHRFETRVDTTTARGTAVGVATEIRPNLWAQVDVSTAQPQQRQTQDISAVTLDWRFRRAWSLRTTVGDRGSSTVEVVWQYRY